MVWSAIWIKHARVSGVFKERQSSTSAKDECYFVFFEKRTYLLHVNLWPFLENCFKLVGLF